VGLQGARGDPACGRPAVGGATLRIIGLSRGVTVPLPAGDWSSSSGGPEHQPWNADETLITVENRDGGSPSPLSLDGSTYQPKSGSCSNYPLWEGLLASEPGARPRADQRHGRRSRAHRPAAAVDSRTARSAGPGSRPRASTASCRTVGTTNGCSRLTRDPRAQTARDAEELLRIRGHGGGRLPLQPRTCRRGAQPVRQRRGRDRRPGWVSPVRTDGERVPVGHVLMVRPRDDTIVALTDPSNEAYAHHFSTRSIGRPG